MTLPNRWASQLIALAALLGAALLLGVWFGGAGWWLAGALAIYGPLIEGTLGNARALGISASLTGPMTRGDVGTLEAHLETLRTHAPDVLDLYVAAAVREVALAESRRALAPEDATKMREVLDSALRRGPEPVP